MWLLFLQVLFNVFGSGAQRVTSIKDLQQKKELVIKMTMNILTSIILTTILILFLPGGINLFYFISHRTNSTLKHPSKLGMDLTNTQTFFDLEKKC